MFFRNPTDRVGALAKADQARARGRVRKAVRWYSTALEFQPGDLHTRAKLAPLLARLQRWDEAQRHFDQSAQGFLDAGFDAKAIAVWTVAAQALPERIEYRERIAEEHVKLGRRAEAAQVLLQGRPLLREKRQRPLAVRLLERALRLQPENLEACFDLAELHRLEGARDAAWELLASLVSRVGRRSTLWRKVRFAQLRLRPSFGGALDWVLAR
jgi:tetratricopeptide (TPR) repeat protein